MIRDPITLVPVNLPMVYEPLHPAYARLSTFALGCALLGLRMASRPALREIAAIQSEFHRRSVRN